MAAYPRPVERTGGRGRLAGAPPRRAFFLREAADSEPQKSTGGGRKCS